MVLYKSMRPRCQSRYVVIQLCTRMEFVIHHHLGPGLLSTYFTSAHPGPWLAKTARGGSEAWSGIQRAGSKFLGLESSSTHIRTSTHGIDGREGGRRNSASRTARGRVREASLSLTLPRRARPQRFGRALVSSIMPMMRMVVHNATIAIHVINNARAWPDGDF